MRAKDSIEFGNLAVALGFLTREDLQKVVALQEEFEKEGAARRFGEICLDKRMLSRDEVLLILRAQGKRILICRRCRKSFNVHHYRQDETYLCKYCTSALALPNRPVEPSVSDSVFMSSTKIRKAIDAAPRIPRDIVHLLPGYEIVERLGQGGMGTVYKARDTILGRWVAIKLLAPFLAMNKEYVKRFFTEARLLQKLKHPHIVEAYDAGVAGDDQKFFLMEFVDGPALDKVLEDQRRIPERWALEIVMQVAEALDFAWRHRVVHRDIKPHNIMLQHDRIPKLCDLGLSKDMGSDISVTMTGSVNCSPPYASPEQAQGLKLDIRSDIYSLGVTLYQLVTGDLPFHGNAPGQFLIQHVTRTPPHPLSKNPSLSLKTCKLILRMMEKSPEDRPMPDVLADALGKYLQKE